MEIFLLLWLIAVTIIFSLVIVCGVYWQKYLYEKLSELPASTGYVVFENQYYEAVDFSYWWLLFILSLITGIFSGWLIEKKINILYKIHLHWQKTQPEFYRTTRGEYRHLLPWLIVALPVLLVSIINIVLIILFNTYTEILLCSFFFLTGLCIGLLIELIKEYKTIMLLDRPEKPPESLLQKITPKFPGKYSLFLGQLYCRILVPLFFIFILIIIPEQFFIIPNMTQVKMAAVLLLIFAGTVIRWFYDRKEYFYFEKITIKNIIFTALKLLVSLVLIFATVILDFSIVIPLAAALLCGFILPWHPEKLRG